MKKKVTLFLSILLLVCFSFQAMGLISIPIKSIKLNVSSISINVGKTYSFKVLYTPTNTSQKLVKYSTSNSNIATVDAKGTVVGKKAGVATITVSSLSNKNLSSKCTVSVKSSVPVKSKITLSILLWKNGNANFPEKTKIGDEIAKRLNINFKPILVQQVDLPIIRSTMVASGDVPSMMPMGANELAFIENYAKSNTIIALDQLLATKGKNIINNLEDEYYKAYKYNNKLYAIPAASKWAMVTQMRGDWLSKLNIDLKTFDNYTLNDYYNILKRFRDEDPDGNGKADTIALAAYEDPACFDNIFAAYGYRLRELYEKDGMIVHGAVMPEMKSALEFIRKLYKEKLIDPEFAITSDKLLRDKIVVGKSGGYYHNYPLATTYNPATANLKKNVPTAYWQAVYPPIGPTGKRGNMKDSPASYASIVITSGCKYPEKAMEYLNFISSDEGSNLSRFGVEGEEYKVVDGIVNYIGEAVDPQKKIALGINAYSLFVQNPNAKLLQDLPKDVEAKTIGLKFGNYGVQLFRTAPSSVEYLQTLTDLIKEQYLKMIVSDGDLNAMFDSFVKAYMSNGGQKLGKDNYEIYKAQGK